MKVKYKVEQETLFFYLEGELDECSATKIRPQMDKIIEENYIVKKAVFNLSMLRFMDSTGIGLLIGRYKKLNSANIKSFIENPLPTVQKVIEISGLYGIMPKIG